MTGNSYDWIVVGAGGAGTAISYFLSRWGLRTLTVEQYSLNHARGSSHGRTRILRTAYSEGPKYVPLVLRARALWRSLGRAARTELFRPTGALIVGAPESAMISGALVSARKSRLPHSILDASEVRTRFPAFRPGSTDIAVWDPGGGVLAPERALQTFVRMARDRGARFRWKSPVVRWLAGQDRVEVITPRERFTAGGLVLACGAWTGAMVSELRLPLAIERQTVFWFRPRRAVRSQFQTMPAFVWQRRGSGYFYGTPDLGHGVKVASDVGDPVQDPGRHSAGSAQRERRLVGTFIRRHLPDLGGPTIDSVGCLYTNTSDHDFLVDFYPGHANVLIVSACSGHGFKFIPAVGEAVAQMAATGRKPRGWTDFGIDRWAPHFAAGRI